MDASSIFPADFVVCPLPVKLGIRHVCHLYQCRTSFYQPFPTVPQIRHLEWPPTQNTA